MTPTCLLDCTLRDGGYYNDWDFSTHLVQDYVTACGLAGIDVVELGFRRLPSDRYLGPLAYTTDEFIAQLEIPDGLTLGVMVDAKQILGGDRPGEVVDQLFAPQAESRVSLVRIAANYPEIERLGPEVERLRELGYRVGVNLMQISARTPEEITEFGAAAHRYGAEVAYIADSFGGLRPSDLAGLIAPLREGFPGPVGCHMHDNMTMGLANSLAAIEAGATWVDGTIMGMGRGPGNAKTEYLAIELTRRGSADIDHLPLLGLVLGPFAELQQHFRWGSNVYYFLSAAFGVHPTYIHELTRDGRYGISEVIAALEDLRGAGGTSFTQGRLDSATSPVLLTQETGDYDATGWCRGRDVLIVAPGPAGQERRADVEAFIKRTGPLVIALNVKPPVDPALVDAYVVCHPIRALIDSDIIGSIDRPVFIPQQIASRLRHGAVGSDLRDYGVAVAPDEFTVSATGCKLPRTEAAAYALALAAIGGAGRVLLSGFDGFGPHDERQEAMVSILEMFAALDEAPPVVAVTRTNYPVEQSSIFAPDIPA